MNNVSAKELYDHVIKIKSGCSPEKGKIKAKDLIELFSIVDNMKEIIEDTERERDESIAELSAMRTFIET